MDEMARHTEYLSLQFIPKTEQPYWNYRDQTPYLTDERNGSRQSIDASGLGGGLGVGGVAAGAGGVGGGGGGGSQSSYEANYTTGGLRSYATDAYPTTGESRGVFLMNEWVR